MVGGSHQQRVTKPNCNCAFPRSLPIVTLSGVYFTEAVTTDVVRWLGTVVGAAAPKPRSSFAYLAHESNHAPLQVPERWTAGGCEDGIPADRPSRRIVCGMMQAVDSSLANVTAAYQRLGVWDQTVVIMRFAFGSVLPCDRGSALS